MKNAQKPEKIALGSLLNQLKEGRFVIPDFQREFEWKPWDIRDLLKSILLDYYIGTLLLWKGKDENFENLSCESIYGHDGTEKREYIVLDGQQRLTALYYALIGPDINFPNRKNPVRFFVRLDRFRDENYDECVEYQFIGKSWRRISDTPKELYARHLFPFTLFGQGARAIISWVDEYKEYWRGQATDAENEGNCEEAKKCFANADYIKTFDTEIEELDRDYQVSYIELDKEIAVEKVCDIFTQINSKGVRLDIFDLLNAMLRPKEIHLKSMWRESSNKLNFLDTPKMNVYVLQVMSILLQSYCSAKYLYFLIPGQPKAIRNPDGSREQVVLIGDKKEFNYHWNEAVGALVKAIEALRNPRDYGAIKSSFIPYPSIVPAFAGIRRYARQNGLLERLDVNQKIRKWYWASIFTNRYSSSVESTSAQDFMALKRWFDDDSEIPTAIREFEESFHNLDLKSENKKGTAVYNAILNLLIIAGAKDLGTFQYPEYADLDDHHIVPASWGRNTIGPEIHSILNKTPISAITNRKMFRDRLPNEYLRELFEKNNKKDVMDILATHYISEKATEILLRPNFGPDDFREFISEREKTLIQGIQQELIDQQISVSIPNRELDEAIESIELGLRMKIVAELGNETSAIPAHLVPKASERMNRMLKKDKTKIASDYESTSALLEFMDFRELEAIITGKKHWSGFEQVFGQKQILLKRFEQLSELRNSLRHSRTLDDVVKMEGEAAILWFKKLIRM